MVFEYEVHVSWMNESKCANDRALLRFIVSHKIDPFFDLKGEAGRNFLDTYCADCPVRHLCRTFAVRYQERGGWGGQDQKTRNQKESVLNRQHAKLLEQMQALWPDGRIPPIFSSSHGVEKT